MNAFVLSQRWLGGAVDLGRELLRGGCTSRCGCRRAGCGSGACSCRRRARRSGSPACCEVPEPCWMPVDLGDVCSKACAGSVVAVRIGVTNDDFRTRSISTAASGPAGAFVEFDVDAFDLGPKERRPIVARMSLPAALQDGSTLESILWVRGCRDHFVRWSVRASSISRGACTCVEVIDRPDYAHRWSDHFFCEHGCRGARLGSP